MNIYIYDSRYNCAQTRMYERVYARPCNVHRMFVRAWYAWTCACSLILICLSRPSFLSPRFSFVPHLLFPLLNLLIVVVFVVVVVVVVVVVCTSFLPSPFARRLLALVVDLIPLKKKANPGTRARICVEMLPSSIFFSALGKRKHLVFEQLNTRWKWGGEVRWGSFKRKKQRRNKKKKVFFCF